MVALAVVVVVGSGVVVVEAVERVVVVAITVELPTTRLVTGEEAKL